MNELKMVIVMRKDLNMRKGKIAAQAAHTAVNVVLNQANSENLSTWLDGLATKICVGVNSEKELLDVLNKAKENNLPVNLVVDAGKTEFHDIPTMTCLAIGPCESDKINEITSHLTLL